MDHDNAYKLLFSHAEMVEDLLRGFVHEAWVGQLDFSTLEKCNGHYVGDQWRERADDVVWRVRFRDEWLYVYLLLEFQSTPDPWMALRMLVYVGLLYQDLVRGRQLTTDGRLPPVLPLVLYNGVPAWTASLDLESLLAPAPGGLERYRPSLRYLLLDEGRIDAAAPEELRNLAAALFRLEQGRAIPDLLAVVRPLRLWLQAEEQASLRRAFAKWLEDMLRSGRVPGADFSPIQDLQEAETMLAERVKQWTEEWKQAGLAQGLKEGIEQGIEQGIERGIEQGIERGIERGIEQGLMRGQWQTQRAIARAMLDIVLDDAVLAARTGVPVEEIAAMRREMARPG